MNEDNLWFTDHLDLSMNGHVILESSCSLVLTSDIVSYLYFLMIASKKDTKYSPFHCEEHLFLFLSLVFTRKVWLLFKLLSNIAEFLPVDNVGIVVWLSGDIFSCHAVDNPDMQSEMSMLQQYGPNVPEDVLRRLVLAFGELRTMADQGLISYPYSTREVVNIVKHLEVQFYTQFKL